MVISKTFAEIDITSKRKVDNKKFLFIIQEEYENTSGIWYKTRSY